MANSRTSLSGWRGAIARLIGLPTMPVQAVQGGTVVGADREAWGGQIASPTLSQTRWLLSDLEHAIHNADLGDISWAAKLWRATRRDGVASGVLSTRTDGLVRLPIRWSGDDAMVREFEGRDRKRGLFATMFPSPELAQLAADGIGLGAGIGEMLPLPRVDEDDEDEPRQYIFRRLEPEWLRFRWDQNRWYFNSIAGPLPIYPGVVRPDGGWWVLHLPGGEMEPWARGLWASLGRAFISKEHAILHRENYSAKLAQAARAAVSPAAATEDQRRGFLAKLVAWGVNQTFDLPPGWDVKLIESNGRGYDVFQATINTSNEEYVVSIAGQTVTTDGGSGFANAEIHKTIRADLIQATADAVALTVNEQGILPYVNLRWGAGALDEAPWMEWDTSPPKEMKAQADSLLQFGLALRSINEALLPYGHRVDVHEMTTRFGVPLAGDPEPDVQPRESSPEGNEETGPAADPGTPAPPLAPKVAPAAMGPGTGNGRQATQKRTAGAIVSRSEWQGLPIAIENPKGSLRTWRDEDGDETGSTLMHHDYGFIEGVLGSDGEELDCYVGPDLGAGYVYVVHQLRAPDFKAHDEDKVMLGFASADAARDAYLAHRNDGERAFGGMSVIPVETFKAKLDRRRGRGKVRATRTSTRLGRHGAIAEQLQLQALVFDRDDFELSEARAWARAWGAPGLEVKIAANEIHLVSAPSSSFDASTLRRIDLGDGVEAICGRELEGEVAA